jgi:hypothetical protein
MGLSFADSIHGNGSLTVAFEAVHTSCPGLKMLVADAAIHALSPAFKTASLQQPSHECDGAWFVQAELEPDGFKGRTILPRHFYDAVRFYGAEMLAEDP